MTHTYEVTLQCVTEHVQEKCVTVEADDLQSAKRIAENAGTGPMPVFSVPGKTQHNIHASHAKMVLPPAPPCPPPPPPPLKFVVLHGCPLTGLTVYGTFDGAFAAGDWADQNLAGSFDYWVTPMRATTATIGDQT